MLNNSVQTAHFELKIIRVILKQKINKITLFTYELNIFD